MNKLKLIIFLIIPVVLLQNCKKDSVTASTLSTAPLQALINGVTTWLPDTISTSVTYNAETKIKVFTCEGTGATKRVTITIALKNATDDGNFPLGFYQIDSTSTATSLMEMKYSVQQKVADGSYAFVDVGTANNGNGTLTITAVDPAKKQITGSFNIKIAVPAVDDSGNVISYSYTTISQGIFNNLVYTYSSN
jgi:hypothetical protein